MRPRHIERHYSSRIGWLRAAVLGANDGLLSTSSLILGIPDKADQGKVISTPEVATENLPASGPDFQLIEIGLGALAIISFVVAWILRRARG